MASTGGFEIAKAFLTVEARLSEESVAKVRREAQSALRGGGLPGGPRMPGRGGGAATRAPIQTRAGLPSTSLRGGGGLGTGGQVSLPSTGDIRSRLRQTRAAFGSAGTEFGKALEGGFTAALGNLGNLAARRVQEAQRSAMNRMANAPTPAGAPAARSRAPAQMTTTSPRGSGVNMADPEKMAARFVSRFAAGMEAAAHRGGAAAGRAGAVGVGAGGQAKVINNYNTRVEIDPRFVKELLQVIRDVNQLKARNRAGPKRASLKRKGEAKRLKALRHKIKAINRAARRAKKQKLPPGKRVWREERHTRFKRAQQRTGELGPHGMRRRAGQFYANTKFRGAFYVDRQATRNRLVSLQAWQQKEVVRRQIAMEEGKPYRPTKRPKIGVVRRWRASAQARGVGVRPGQYGFASGTSRAAMSAARSRSRRRSRTRF